MKNLENKVVGLRSKESNKLVSVYPEKLKGSDEEIEKIVKDWHYKQNCEAEDDLATSFVDTLTDEEIKSRNL